MNSCSIVRPPTAIRRGPGVGMLAAGVFAAGVLAAGCQHDIKTPFPPGLEPLEDNPVPEQTAPYQETLATDVSNDGYAHVYGRGYVMADPATVWKMVKNPDVMIAKCTTSKQSVTPDDEPQYEYSFLVAYEVDNIVTVQWNDAWRYGTVEGTPDAPLLGMIKHQKTDGSSFIKRDEGTTQITPAPDDPNVTEVAIVEHLDAVGGSSDTVLEGVQHEYAAIVAVSHGQAIPPCP